MNAAAVKAKRPKVNSNSPPKDSLAKLSFNDNEQDVLLMMTANKVVPVARKQIPITVQHRKVEPAKLNNRLASAKREPSAKLATIEPKTAGTTLARNASNLSTADGLKVEKSIEEAIKKL